MAEPNDQSTIDNTAEIEILRRVNTELLQAKHTLKARIATLESEAATLESRTEKAESTMRAAVVDVPLKRLAAEISHVPELFLTELHKDYDVVPTDEGTLSLLAKDGKPVTSRDGKPLDFNHVGLYTLLAGKLNEPKSDREKVYATLMKYAGSSGGAGRKISSSSRATSSESDKTEIAPSFGLR